MLKKLVDYDSDSNESNDSIKNCKKTKVINKKVIDLRNLPISNKLNLDIKN